MISFEGTEIVDRRRNKNVTNSEGCEDYLGKSIEKYQLYIPAGMCQMVADNGFITK